MKNLTFKIIAVIIMEDGSSETCSFIQTNTSMIGAIKEVERIAKRAGVRKVRVIRCMDYEF